MAKRSRAASSKRKGEKPPSQVDLRANAKRRSLAAKKGAATKRRNAKKEARAADARSERSKKGWETRRKSAAERARKQTPSKPSRKASIEPAHKKAGQGPPPARAATRKGPTGKTVARSKPSAKDRLEKDRARRKARAERLRKKGYTESQIRGRPKPGEHSLSFLREIRRAVEQEKGTGDRHDVSQRLSDMLGYSRSPLERAKALADFFEANGLSRHEAYSLFYSP